MQNSALNMVKTASVMQATLFDDCMVSISDEFGRLMHVVPVIPNSNTPNLSEAPSRKMTDNYDRKSSESISVLSFRDRFTNSFMQSSDRLMKNLIPKTIQVDEVFEINSDSLQDIETVSLTLWKSRDDFEKAYF